MRSLRAARSPARGSPDTGLTRHKTAARQWSIPQVNAHGNPCGTKAAACLCCKKGRRQAAGFPRQEVAGCPAATPLVLQSQAGAERSCPVLPPAHPALGKRSLPPPMPAFAAVPHCRPARPRGARTDSCRSAWPATSTPIPYAQTAAGASTALIQGKHSATRRCHFIGVSPSNASANSRQGSAACMQKPRAPEVKGGSCYGILAGQAGGEHPRVIGAERHRVACGGWAGRYSSGQREGPGWNHTRQGWQSTKCSLRRWAGGRGARGAHPGRKRRSGGAGRRARCR